MMLMLIKRRVLWWSNTNNVPWRLVRRSYSLPVKDREGRAWEFVIKSWANGTEHRRVYVLEQVSEYIRHNHLREGDSIGICADEAGIVTIEVRHTRNCCCRTLLVRKSNDEDAWKEPLG